MNGNEEQLMRVIEAELDDRDPQTPAKADRLPSTPRAPPGTTSLGRFYHAVFSSVERIFLSPTTQRVITKGKRKRFRRYSSHDVEVVDVAKELRCMKTCDIAFVVFHTEAERNRALAVTKEKGVLFRNTVLRLEGAAFEPRSIFWENMHLGKRSQMLRVIFGLGAILLALIAWAGLFFLPYAYFTMSYNYANGQEPELHEAITFSLVVVGGNAIMYLVCSEVADMIRFRIIEDREVCYMLLYGLACVFNVVLDIVVCYYVAYYQMVGRDVKSYDGQPIAEMDNWEKFKSYPMQRELGGLMVSYSFPATFLIPFLAEPIITIYVPYAIMKLIVRSHPEVVGMYAEDYLATTPLDLSRYADVLLNVVLAVMILFFPGGYMTVLFTGLVVSHLYIYIYDQYRILRVVPNTVFSENSVDWWAQWMFCIPCGLLLSCAVFKGNCQAGIRDVVEQTVGMQEEELVCDHSPALLAKMGFVFVCHVILHTLTLLFIVPWFGKIEKRCERVHYEHVALKHPRSYFSVNPVHCLRSQHMYGHEPPCDYCLAGKEHLLRRNPHIGIYFEEGQAAAEEYDENDVLDEFRSISKGIRTMSKSIADGVRRSFAGRGVDTVRDANAPLERGASASSSESIHGVEKSAPAG
eukprot:gnl/TRDRNA2_/TRDRNA2_122294_c0_seq1.p1 gnl/TRDRNA2_/TRDRNA2_122294_c0~~gnl/TRDRNA2_/TRDRNA2_122294_c0_seq1.p1  ORF type:complete len:689 (-),score=86.88 gnl/TRDRNA2_/TRDRNA2_122294_c0_seq1:33-1937(-)